MKKEQSHSGTTLLKQFKNNQFFQQILCIKENFEVLIASWLNRFNPKIVCHENKL